MFSPHVKLEMAEMMLAKEKEGEKSNKTPEIAPKKRMEKTLSTAKPPQAVKPSSSKQGTTKENTPPANVNKELLSILDELNKNLNRQNQDIQKLNQRVDNICNESEGCVYGYDEDYHYEENQSYEYQSEMGQSEVDVSSQQEIQSEPPSKRPTFKGLSDKFLMADKVDPEVNDDLALFVNSSFRNGVSEERVQEMTKGTNRPVNCDALTKTRVNLGIWRFLKPGTQFDDNKMQAIQTCIVKASVNLVKLLDKEGEALDSESIDLGTNALALLGQSNKLINNKRKESHKNDLDPKYFPLTSPSLPFTDYLYGNESDINRNVKDIQDMSRIGKVGRSFGGRGFRAAPYRRGYNSRPFHRGGYRGQGYARTYSTESTAPKNMRERQKK